MCAVVHMGKRQHSAHVGARALMCKRRCGDCMGVLEHVHMCKTAVRGWCIRRGAESLSLWPGLAQALDRHWATDQRLGTPGLHCIFEL